MPDSDHSLIFQDAGGLRDRALIRRFAATLRRRVTGGNSFCCLITSDAELRKLNREFLGNDYPTDVLSFPSGRRNGFIGDLAISADRARDQSRRFGHTQREEIFILMLHGVLHLMGMDHETDSGLMRGIEMDWRKRLGLPAGLIERMAS
jgi:probable rRNA maturation factor